MTKTDHSITGAVLCLLILAAVALPHGALASNGDRLEPILHLLLKRNHSTPQPPVTAHFPIGARPVASTPLEQGTLFAATDGSGTTCSRALPCSVSTAIDRLVPGSVLFLRGGRYNLGQRLDVAASGTAAEPIIIESYPGEQAILDGGETIAHLKKNPFSGFNGLRLRGDHIHVRKLEITGMGGAGLYIRGSHKGMKVYPSHVEWEIRLYCFPKSCKKFAFLAV